MALNDPKKTRPEQIGRPSNLGKRPDRWVTGDQPMTDAQSSYLQTLSEHAGVAFNPKLTKAEAATAIDALQQMTGLGVGTQSDRGLSTEQIVEEAQLVQRDQGSSLNLSDLSLEEVLKELGLEPIESERETRQPAEQVQQTAPQEPPQAPQPRRPRPAPQTRRNIHTAAETPMLRQGEARSNRQNSAGGVPRQQAVRRSRETQFDNPVTGGLGENPYTEH